MWIRNQWERKIAQIQEVFVRPTSEGTWVVVGNGEYLGEYPNEEKALKVLDMIQGAINLEPQMVFNMPKNEDVNINGED